MKISSPSDENPRDSRALARFAAVQIVEQAVQNGNPLVQAAQQAAQQPWDGRYFSAATIEDWYYKHKRGEFAALQDQPRSDRGKHKALDPAAVEALLQLRREHPKLTVRALIGQLVRLGVLQLGTFSESTILRRLAEAGLDRQSLHAGSGLIGGPTKAFELPLPNLLWMADCRYGPTLQIADGQTQRTFLFALIDDCTRLLIHGQFYPQERLEGFLDTLRKAVQTRGLPDKCYTDFVPRHKIGVMCPTALCGRERRSPRWFARGWAHNNQRDFSQLSSSVSFRHLALCKKAELPTGGWHAAKASCFMRSVISA